LMQGGVRLKACLLILLLAGNEAVRIDTLRSAVRAPPVEDGVELSGKTRWQSINQERCSWNLFRGGCVGDGCRYRPLPLDKSLSQRCRLSNAFMLNDEPNIPTYLDIQAQLLEERAEEFKDNCVKNISVFQIARKENMQCYRRANHMFQLTEFLTEAEKEMLKRNIYQEKGEEIKQRMEKAMAALSSTLGEDGKYYMELANKTRRNVLPAVTDPVGTMVKTVTTMRKLMSRNVGQKEEARKEIEEMHVPEEMPANEDYKVALKSMQPLGDVAPEPASVDDVAPELGGDKATDEIWKRLLPWEDWAASSNLSAELRSRDEVRSEDYLLYLKNFAKVRGTDFDEQGCQDSFRFLWDYRGSKPPTWNYHWYNWLVKRLKVSGRDSGPTSNSSANLKQAVKKLEDALEESMEEIQDEPESVDASGSQAAALLEMDDSNYIDSQGFFISLVKLVFILLILLLWGTLILLYFTAPAATKPPYLMIMGILMGWQLIFYWMTRRPKTKGLQHRDYNLDASAEIISAATADESNSSSRRRRDGSKGSTGSRGSSGKADDSHDYSWSEDDAWVEEHQVVGTKVDAPVAPEKDEETLEEVEAEHEPAKKGSRGSRGSKGSRGSRGSKGSRGSRGSIGSNSKDMEDNSEDTRPKRPPRADQEEEAADPAPDHDSSQNRRRRRDGSNSRGSKGSVERPQRPSRADMKESGGDQGTL